MDIIEKLCEKSAWEDYYNYKLDKEDDENKFIVSLRNFIDNEDYISFFENIKKRAPFPHPEKVLVNKSKTGKKRVVYTFPEKENFILKFISYQLKAYDNLFAPNLYSFRKNKTVKSAWNYILRINDLNKKYVYKVDISSYFNSVNPENFIPILKSALQHNSELCDFLEEILLNPYAIYKGDVIKEAKGILPGVPVSAFFANLYLSELDHFFFENNVPYFRYSDDIIVFADNDEKLNEYITTIKNHLKSKGLEINPEKETITQPGEKWDFLGFCYHNGTIDVSEVAVKKLKAKMRRKSRALLRWAEKKNYPSEYAVKAFIKRFNAKLYDNPIHNELTWCRWYFPIITTDASLKAIDEYMQDCIRFLATGKRNKSRYNFTYENIKNSGYRNLVNEYYKFKENTYDIN